MNDTVKAILKAITKMKESRSIEESYKTQRVLEDASGRLSLPSLRCHVADSVAIAEDGYPIPLKVFTPLDIDFSLRTGLKMNDDFRGTILFFHGGGWANGDVGFYIDACIRTALQLERRVVAVDYRRSPEHKFPAALSDCYDVAFQLYKGDILYDVDPDRIVLFGDSAGGNLAAATSLLARETGDFDVRTQMLLYPLLYDDHSETTMFDSVRENGEDFLLTRKEIEGYVDMYLEREEDRLNPFFAPLLAKDLSNQPRTLVMTAEFCPLRDEGETYAERLVEDGNDVECVRILNGVHGYFLYPSVLSLVRDTNTVMKRFLDGPGDEEGIEAENKGWLEILGTR